MFQVKWDLLLLITASVFFFPLGKNLVFVDLWTFALMEGEKMKCEVILPWNEIRGKIMNIIFTKLYMLQILIRKQEHLWSRSSGRESHGVLKVLLFALLGWPQKQV